MVSEPGVRNGDEHSHFKSSPPIKDTNLFRATELPDSVREAAGRTSEMSGKLSKDSNIRLDKSNSMSATGAPMVKGASPEGGMTK